MNEQTGSPYLRGVSAGAAVDRRVFLASGVCLSASGVLHALCGESGADDAPAAKEERDTGARSSFEERVAGHGFVLGCAGYSFRQQLSGDDPEMTLEDFIDFCAAQGVAGTELTSYYFRRTDREYLVALKRRAFLNGLTVTGVPVGNNFCLPPGEERRQQIAHVKSWIEHAAVLGAPCMRIFAGSPPRGGSEEQAREWAIECLRETAKHAAEFGVVLALENHGGITSSAAQLLRLIEEADSPWLGVNLDTGNFQQNPYAEIEKVAPRAVVVQHKVEVRGPSGHEPADFPRILGILEAAGYRGVIALEYEARANPLEAVPRHLAAMRRALAERA